MMTNNNNHQNIIRQRFIAGTQGYTYLESAQNLHWFFIPYDSFPTLLNRLEGKEYLISSIIEDIDTLQRLNTLHIDVYQLAGVLERYSLLVKPMEVTSAEFQDIQNAESFKPLENMPHIVGVECPRTYVARVWFHKHQVKYIDLWK